jgi:hypothetical protein
MELAISKKRIKKNIVPSKQPGKSPNPRSRGHLSGTVKKAAERSALSSQSDIGGGVSFRTKLHAGGRPGDNSHESI